MYYYKIGGTVISLPDVIGSDFSFAVSITQQEYNDVLNPPEIILTLSEKRVILENKIKILLSDSDWAFLADNYYYLTEACLDNFKTYRKDLRVLLNSVPTSDPDLITMPTLPTVNKKSISNNTDLSNPTNVKLDELSSTMDTLLISNLTQ